MKTCYLDDNELDQLTKNCYLQNLLRSFNALQRQIHTKTGQEKAVLQRYVSKLELKLMKALNEASCYPHQCAQCPGKERCMNCPQKALCIQRTNTSALLNLEIKNATKKMTHNIEIET